MQTTHLFLGSIGVLAVNGVPSEWRVRNLDVIQRSEKHGVDVPLFRHLTTLVRLGEPSDRP